MWPILVAVLILLVLILRPTYREPVIIKGFLSDDECEYIKSIVKDKLKPSTISDQMVEDPTVRKSETAWIDHTDPVIRNIMHRCTDDRTKCESLQVLRYTPGGFYRPHQDADVTHTNKRAHTFIFALNDEYEGGKTCFPVLDKKYRLQKGDALSFDTLNSWGRVPKQAIHGGEPVVSGEKWIANLWIRQSSYA